MRLIRFVCTTLLPLSLIACVAFFTHRLAYHHTRDFNSVDDRQNVVQLILEGMDIVQRYASENREWAEAHHAARNLTGQVVILTGSTKGLGRGIASHLAAFGATLVLPCRRCDFKAMRDQLFSDAERNAYGTKLSPLRLAEPLYFDVDLADLNEIDAMVSALESRADLPRAIALISNAGLVSSTDSRTKQGFETTFGVNFVASAYLTQRLLDAELLAPQARIVSVSSEDHRVATPIAELLETRRIEFGQPWGTGLLDAMPRYDFSKLVATTYFLALAKRVPEGMTVVDMCPGPVGSDIALSSVPGVLGQLVKRAMDLFLVPIEAAAVPVLRLALGGREVHGQHFHISEQRPARGDARDEEMQNKVYEWTQRLLRERAPPK